MESTAYINNIMQKNVHNSIGCNSKNKANPNKNGKQFKWPSQQNGEIGCGTFIQ